LILFLLGLIGFLAFLSLCKYAFPIASIDMKVSRKEAIRIARDLASRMGWDTRGFIVCATFRERKMESYYLQRTLPLFSVNEVMKEDIVPIWHWYVRFFKEGEKEEYGFGISPVGNIVFLERILHEDAPGGDLPVEAARSIAENAVSLLGGSLKGYSFQGVSTERKARRTDHIFTWERPLTLSGRKLKACMRISVGVSGSSISYYNVWLKIPEDFSRSFHMERAFSRTIYGIGMMLSAVLLLWAGVFVARMYKRDELRIRPLAVIGGLAFGLIVADAVNWIPIALSVYPTSEKLLTFIWDWTYSFLQEGVLALMVIIVAGAAGDWVSRKAFGRGKLVWGEGDPVFLAGMAVLRGISLAFLALGLVSVAGLLASRYDYFGIWIPILPRYSNMMGTYLPFLTPLLSGLVPATTEEALFRLFAISAMVWRFRRTWIAILVPAIIWATLHAGYITSPFYLRVIEVSITGVIYGLIFLKVDLLSLISAHYTFNAAIIGFPLLISGRTDMIAFGLLPIALAFVPVLLGILPKGLFIGKHRNPL
jgi:hypothetical protein